MNVLSLFSGIGGIDIGLETHGCTTVAYSEIDPYASKIMASHFPDAVNIGDVTTADWTTLDAIDIIAGGFPCQDISLAGAGAGIADGTRSGLWKNYADAIRVLRPRGVLVENVAAITSRGMDRVLGDLAACGYDAEWDCIPAAALGAPHLRDRMFIVAYRADIGRTTGRPAGNADSARADAHTPTGTPREATREPGGSHGPDADSDRGGTAARSGRPSPGRRRLETPTDPMRVGQSGPGEPVEPSDPATRTDRQTTHVVDGRGWPQPTPSEWWRVEPDVGRMAHGIPNRVDRLRCLGNAVVPQVAEHVAGILIDRIRGTR